MTLKRLDCELAIGLMTTVQPFTIEDVEMTKTGRFFIPLDLNWYDEWGHAVSNEAALLWVLVLCAAKRMQNVTGEITLSQMRRAAPEGMSEEAFNSAVDELLGCEIAPIRPRYRTDGDTMSGGVSGVILDGWSDWNEPSEAALMGNHLRWHVQRGKPNSTCGFCFPENGSSPRFVPDSLDDSHPNPKSRVEKSRVDIESARAKRTPSVATSPPDEFPITDALRSWATANRIVANLEWETEKFLDHHRSKGNKMKDWTSAWRKWMRNTLDFAQQKTNASPLSEPPPVANAIPMFKSKAERDAAYAEFGEPVELTR